MAPRGYRLFNFIELGLRPLNPLGYALIGVVAAGIGLRDTFAIVLGSHVLMMVWLLASRDVGAITRDPDNSPGNLTAPASTQAL